jgi:hypothetical protein
MSVKSSGKAKKPRVVHTFETILSFIADLKLANQESVSDVNIGMLFALVRTVLADK